MLLISLFIKYFLLISFPIKFIIIINYYNHYNHNWGSVIGMVTRYGLDVLGIESWWRREFLHPSRLGQGPTQPLYSGCWVSFPGVK
jgi:hypothetical protein